MSFKQFDQLIPTCIKDLYNCPYYWDKIDRNEAKTILEKKPSGSYLMIVSKLWKYELVIKIGNNFLILPFTIFARQGFRFNFLIYPVLRKKPFSLPDLCRAVICDALPTSDDVLNLQIPETLKNFLRTNMDKQKFNFPDDVSKNEEQFSDLAGILQETIITLSLTEDGI